MTSPTRGELWKQLKDAGVQPAKHFREYSTAELQAAVDKLEGRVTEPAAPGNDPAAFQAAYQALLAEEEAPGPSIPVSSEPVGDPRLRNQAGTTQNTHGPDEPLRIDPETGYIWYLEEVRKAGHAAPRGRRIVPFTDTGVKEATFRDGAGDSEMFELPGDQRRRGEAKVTLPSYQVGIYKDPRFPFKIHVYNEDRGFDLFEVWEFFGGRDLVPDTCKVKYVSSTLCYDMQTTIRTIQDIAREKNLI